MFLVLLECVFLKLHFVAGKEYSVRRPMYLGEGVT